jgi:hypothetical protein
VPLLVTIAGMAGLGFVCDDLLRFRVPHLVAQTIEETSETVAAVLYAMIVGKMWYLHSKGAAVRR